MTWTNRVVWQEGMFLRSQHFQQQDRHLEHLVRTGLADRFLPELPGLALEQDRDERLAIQRQRQRVANIRVVKRRR